MIEKNKIVIPTNSLAFHNKLKSELLNDFPPIFVLQSPKGTTPTPSNTTVVSNSLIRAGYFRPKTKQASVPPSQVFPNYMKRDAREYPPMHCCEWRPKSTTGEANVIGVTRPRTKHVHHTLFDAGRYYQARESPTILSVNKQVFGRSVATPVNLLSTESLQFDQLSIGKQPLLTEPGEQNEENPLQTSMVSSVSKILSPKSSKGFGDVREFRGSFKVVDSAKIDRFKEKFEATQKDFKMVQLRIDEVARKKRGWYQDNMNETAEVKGRIKEGSLLLGSMNSSHNREEMRFAVRLGKVHSRYEKSWKKLGSVSYHKESEEMGRPHSKLRHLIAENSHEVNKVFNTSPDL